MTETPGSAPATVTPGQAAFDEYVRAAGLGGPIPWDELSGREAVLWAGVAQAAAAPLREQLAELLDGHAPTGSGHVSRMSRVTLIRHRLRAELPVTDEERRMAGA
jgi:hypothetical protein